MYSLSDLKVGKTVVVENDPYIVLSAQFSKQGRQGGVSATKLRNLKTGAVIQKTFQGSDKIEPADIRYRHAQFLYEESGSFTFMDLQTYDQFTLSQEVTEEDRQWLKDGLELDILTYEELPIGIKLPITIDLVVQETTPGVKGDTAQGGSKPATLENSTVIQVPLFVEEGETVRVNTERGEYVERV